MNTKTSDVINRHLTAMLDGEPIPAMKSEDLSQLIAALGHAVRDRGELERIGLKTTALLLARAEASLRAQRECALMIDRGNNLC